MWYVNDELQGLYQQEEMGFILTIWYVNYSKYTEKGCNITCFILTMWYVNLWDNRL